MLDMAEAEVSALRQSMEAGERARQAAEQAARASGEEAEELRRRLEEEGRRATDTSEGLRAKLTTAEVEASMAAAVWALEKDKMREEQRAELQRARDEAREAVDRAEVGRSKAEAEVRSLCVDGGACHRGPG
jgi:hypothetical protein